MNYFDVPKEGHILQVPDGRKFRIPNNSRFFAIRHNGVPIDMGSLKPFREIKPKIRKE